MQMGFVNTYCLVYMCACDLFMCGPVQQHVAAAELRPGDWRLEYALALSKKTLIAPFGQHSKSIEGRSMGFFINRCDNSSRNNARFTIDHSQQTPRVFIVARSVIRPFDFIHAAYGRAHQSRVSH